MFGWLKIKKPKPTAMGIAALRGEDSGRSLSETTAAGIEELSAASAALPPHPLLSLLPPSTINRLLREGAMSDYTKGTVLFHAGDPCDAVLLIVSGRCETRVPVEGEPVGRMEDVYGPGDMLGARALLTGGPHRADAVVVTHCVLLRVPAEELRKLFASDYCLAGRFSQVVSAHVESLNEHHVPDHPRVRRIVSLLPMSGRADVTEMVRRLASELYAATGQRVLLLHFSDHEKLSGVRLGHDVLNGTFAFANRLHRTAEGCDELHLSVQAENQDTAAVAPLLSHCGRHYDFVLLLLSPETPVPTSLEALIQSDLGYVLLQPDTQHLYDFRLFLQELMERSHGACQHIKPILLAEEGAADPEVVTHLRSLGCSVHSALQSFPLLDGSARPDRRFDLAVRRLAREIACCRIGLALSSGGAKGLAHIGVIQVLEEAGIEVDCIAGASMGAYVAALWAYGFDGAGLEKIAREVEGRWGLLHLIDPALPPRRGFLRTRRTAARLRHAIGSAHFSELLRPLRVVTTQLDTLERVVFSCGEVVPAVEASIAIPGVCVPVTFEGETYIDGGIADPLPVDVLEEMGIERIIAVNVIPPPERIRYWLDAARETSGRESKRGGLGRFVESRLNYGARGNILDTMMRAINGAQTRVAEASARRADVVLRPLTGDAVWHDFTNPQKYIALGRSVAEAQLTELKALAGFPTYEPSTSMAFGPALAT